MLLRPLRKGERVVDVGSGAGFDCFVAAHRVGPSGRVVGVDMTEEMLSKARVPRPGGHLEFVDIANGRPVPAAAIELRPLSVD